MQVQRGARQGKAGAIHRRWRHAHLASPSREHRTGRETAAICLFTFCAYPVMVDVGISHLSPHSFSGV